jgi:hypothetical protein
LVAHLCERRLDAEDRRQRSVELAQPDRVKAQGAELCQPPAQLDRFWDRRRVELLDNVAPDPDRLDVTKIFEAGAEREAVEDMNDPAVGRRIGTPRRNRRRDDDRQGCRECRNEPRRARSPGALGVETHATAPPARSIRAPPAIALNPLPR